MPYILSQQFIKPQKNCILYLHIIKQQQFKIFAIYFSQMGLFLILTTISTVEYLLLRLGHFKSVWAPGILIFVGPTPHYIYYIKCTHIKYDLYMSQVEVNQFSKCHISEAFKATSFDFSGLKIYYNQKILFQVSNISICPCKKSHALGIVHKMDKNVLMYRALFQMLLIVRSLRVPAVQKFIIHLYIFSFFFLSPYLLPIGVLKNSVLIINSFHYSA